MSYILEALKKAQAERQLGNAPTIHATQPVQADQPGVAASRKPLFIGLGAGALVVAAGALFMWQRGPAPAAVPVAVPASAPAVSGRELAATPPAPASAAVGAASNTLEVSAPPEPVAPPRPAHVAEPHVAEPRVAEAPARPAPSAAGRAGTEARAPAAVAAPATAPAPAPALPAAVRSAPLAAATRAAPAPAPTPAPAPASAPAPEDSLPYLHQLPDAIQRDIPRVSFGGYMYSANPADRLLLVDKALRHEGEEVGPGLVLEKLLPKAAVMNYRGVRYRVAY
jgi:general secretion pathway protein B